MVSESRIEQHRLGHSQVGNRRGFRGIGRDQIGDAHDVDDATKEEALDHLENKLKKVLEEISDAKVPQVEEHAPVINEDELSTSEEEIAAIMDKVLARARAEDGCLDDNKSQISLTDIVALLDKMNTSLSKRLQVESFETASDALSKKSFENNNHENSSADVQEKEKGKNEIVKKKICYLKHSINNLITGKHE